MTFTPPYRVWPKPRPHGKIVVIDANGKIVSEHDTAEQAHQSLAAQGEQDRS